MSALLAKYRCAFLVGLQSNLVYRWNFAVRGGFSFFHMVVVFVLWRAAYGAARMIGGFTFGATLTYFLTLVVMQFFIGAFNEDYQVSEEIRNGLINQFLLKPINYFAYRFSIFAAARLISGGLILLPMAAAVLVLRHFVVLPEGAWRLLIGLPALGLSAVIQFSIAYCFGMLTFWFLEIQGFVILSMAIETILGGQVFPLDLMPARLFHAVQYLPFFYQMYFPAAILTGRIAAPAEALRGLCIQAAWVFVLLALAQGLWTRGLRRHTAVGG